MGSKVAATELQGLKQHMTLAIDPRLAPVHLNATMWANHFSRKSDFSFSSHNIKDRRENYLGRAF